MDFLETILEEKRKEVRKMPLEIEREVPKRVSFYDLVMNHPERIHVIGEMKRSSPSKGKINHHVEAVQQAKKYEEAGVSAISVLTDPTFFKGSIDDLYEISLEITTPLLCKDFIISEKQLIRAKNNGASMVLLIVAALELKEITHLFHQAKKLDLEVLVETHNQKELEIAEALGAKIIGVNNRNLKTFDVSIEVSEAIQLNRKEVCYISESGFQTKEDVERIASKFNGILVGETLMKRPDILQTLEDLRVIRK